MRQDAVSLDRFYASPLGQAAATVLSGTLSDLWGEARGLSVLGIGYALPVLATFGDAPARLIAAVPYEHGPVYWDAPGRGNAAVAVGDLRLPFPDGLFDRVIILHGLEETGDPRAYLREVWRVMAPEGRLVLAAANRTGLWARATQTPFGQGRPWTRTQLINLLSAGVFQVTASSSALYVPPLPLGFVAASAEGWEVLGRALAPGLGGVVLVEAVKRLYAGPGGGTPSPVTEHWKPARPATANGRETH
jgi:SAM-dependent methyltransferase